jgi:hypothetical protein
MTHTEKSIFGFTSFTDLAKQMFKYDQVNLHKLLNLAIAMTLFLFFLPFLEQYIWSPFWTLGIFYAVLTLDFVTAVAASWDERKFVTSKAIKFPFTAVSYFILFGILHSLGKAVEAFQLSDVLNPVAFRFLAISTYFLCFTINMLSSLKHMSKLGLIPRAVAKYIERFIDIHKNKLEEQAETIINPEKPNENGPNV